MSRLSPQFPRAFRAPGRSGKGGLAVLIVAGLSMLAALPAHAQNGRITGVVTDAQSGATVGEVQVYVVGSTLGTLTRSNGRYLILNVPPGSYELRAERIGFQTVTESVDVPVDGTVTRDFAMTTEALGLDEIVVTGAAGAARRREIGNAIAQINLTDIPEREANVSDLLQAAAPGIQVIGGSSEPAQGKQIRLRGNSSVAMSNQPIIYVDGVRIMDDAFPVVATPGTGLGRPSLITVTPLDMINPNDIERIEVIKGSAATTLYGTEASAGVIQVFTKRGSTGAPVWTAEIQQGTGWMQPFGAPGGDFIQMEHYMRDAWWGGGYEGGQYSTDCVTDDDRWRGVNSSASGPCSFPGSVWFQNYLLSVRGGGEALQYFISGQFQDDSYVLANDELEKYNFRGNFTMTPVEDLQIQWNTGYTSQWLSGTPSGNNAEGIQLNAFRQERNYVGSADPREIGKLLEYEFDQRNERLNSGITLTYTPQAQLTNRFTFGYDYSNQEGENQRNFGFFLKPLGSRTNDTFQRRVLTFDYVGTYTLPVTSTINSNFSWGGQAIGDSQVRLRLLGEDFPGAAEPTVSSAAIKVAEEDREKVWNAGFFVQNVFDISNKYFVTGGIRVDGNSAFGSGFGLQVYPKVSGTWVISDEDFWDAGLGSIKLRAAYGQSGRAPGAFDAVRTWSPAGYAGTPAFTPFNLGNPDLGPEVSREWEFGFDASWLDDRLSATFTYFDQQTTDALMFVSAVPSQGFTRSQLQNVGTVGANGIELQLDARLFQSTSFSVDAGLGVSTYNSEVMSLCKGETEPSDVVLARDPAAECISRFSDLNGWIIEGQALPVEMGRRVINRDEIADPQFADSPLTPALPGRTGENVIIGPQMPTHTITPSLAVRLPGNILLSARGEYMGGHVAYINEISISRSVRSPLCFPWYVSPKTSIELKAETPAIWRERCTPGFARDYWFDSDYFKLRNVSLTVPADALFPERVSNATFTATLSNFYDWYREIPWYDPESLGNEPALDDGIGNQTERVPSPVTFRMSMRVTF